VVQRQVQRNGFRRDARAKRTLGIADLFGRFGFESVALLSQWGYRIATHWNVGTNVSFACLRGDATNSPITEKTSRITYSLFANYIFQSSDYESVAI
jgi:hypothetical protein